MAGRQRGVVPLRRAGALLAVFGWLSAAFAAGQAGGGEAEASSDADVAERRLRDASARVAAAVGKLHRIREALAPEPAETLDALRRGLGASDLGALEGRSERVRELSERLERLQGRGRELAAAPSSSSCASSTSARRSAEASEPADGEEEAEEDREQQEDEEEGSEGADSEASCDGAASVAASAEVPAFAAELEDLARDLEVHVARVRMTALSWLPPSSRGCPATSGGGFAAPGDGSLGGAGRRSSFSRFDAPGSASAGAGAGAGASAGGVGAAAAAAAAVGRLGEIAKRLGDGEARAAARRLGARLAQLPSQGGGGSEERASAEALAAEAEAALAAAELRAAGGAAGTYGEASSQSPDFGDGGDSDGAFGDMPLLGAECRASSVRAAGARFDATLRGFSTRIMQVMLPPEVDNLHRVVHTLEVLKNSLLRELELPAGAPPTMDDYALAGECARYFSGVGQLEADLARYLEMAEEASGGGRKKPKATKLLAGGEDAGGTLALPQRPLEPLAPLAPLVATESLPPPGARPGGGAGAPAGDPARPALNARAFR